MLFYINIKISVSLHFKDKVLNRWFYVLLDRDKLISHRGRYRTSSTDGCLNLHSVKFISVAAVLLRSNFATSIKILNDNVFAIRHNRLKKVKNAINKNCIFTFKYISFCQIKYQLKNLKKIIFLNVLNYRTLVNLFNVSLFYSVSNSGEVDSLYFFPG